MARTCPGNDSALISGSLATSVVDNFTMSCWVKVTAIGATTNNARPFMNGNGSNEAFQISNNATSTISGFFGGVANFGTFNPVVNTWYNLVISRNAGTATFYRNAVSQGTTAGTPIVPTTRTSVQDGSASNNCAPFVIADCAIWTTPLTLAEITALAQGARPGVIRPGSLVLWWPLDGLQSPEPDLSGNKNNGTVTGTTTTNLGPPFSPFTPRWPQGPIFFPQPAAWGARSFNGTSDFINVPTSASISPTSAITIVTWSFFNVINAFNHLIVKTAAATWVSPFADYILRGNNVVNGNINFTVNQSGTLQGISSPTALTASVWQHIAGTFDGTTFRTYLNGAQDATGTHAGTIAANGKDLHLGWDNTGDTAFLNGRMADTAIWNVALTAFEVKALANGARPNTIRPSALVGWWPLDGLQSPELDISGNKNNGTLTGTTAAFGPPYAPFTPRWPEANDIFVDTFANEPQLVMM